MRKVNLDRQRVALIENELRMLGIRDETVLQAMRTVPREEFVSAELREFAYRNAPLPIGSGQTISQPLIVAYMIEALELAPDERVLEIGTGSGYAAAVLSRVAREVLTVERHLELADTARQRLARLGYDNVHVLHADGTRGWPAHAPYDAIVVAAGGPGVPSALLQQLRTGGRLVMPVGEEHESQRLIRVIGRGDDDYEYEELGAVRFVPLIGEAGWQNDEEIEPPKIPSGISERRPGLPEMIRQVAEPIASVDRPDLQNLLERIGDARLVLIGDPPRIAKTDIQPLTPEQVGALLLAAQGDRLEALYMVAIASGLRLGELFALQWPDVDLKAGTISVRHTLAEVGGKLTLTELKTSKGRRLVTLPQPAVDALVAHRKRMIVEGWAAVPFVFVNSTGGPLRRSHLHRNCFKPLLKAAGLPDMRFHDLRHTSATLLLAQGVHPKVVQERLGHSQISVTLDTYSHVLPAMEKDAASRLDLMLVAAKPKESGSKMAVKTG